MAVDDDEADKGVQGRMSCLRVQQRYLLQSLEQAQAQIAVMQAQLDQAALARDAAQQAQVMADSACRSSLARLKAEHEGQVAREQAKMSSLENQLRMLQERCEQTLQEAFSRAQLENDMALARDELREKNETISELRLQIERLQRIRESRMHNIEELRVAAVDQKRLHQMEKEMQRFSEVSLQLAQKEEMIIGLQDKTARLEKSLADYATLSERYHGLEEKLGDWYRSFAKISGQATASPNPFELVRFCNSLKEDQIKSSNRLQQSKEMTTSLQQEVSMLHADSLRLRSERAQLDFKMTEMQNQIAAVSAENAKLSQESKGLRDMILSYEAEKHPSEQIDLSEIESTRKELERLKSIEAEVTNLRETCDFLQSQNEELQSQIQRQSS